MAHAAGHAVQRLLRDPAHVDAEPARIALDLDDPRVLAAGLQQHLAHVLGIVLQCRGDRVEADDPLGLLAHVAIVPLLLSLRMQGEAGRGLLLPRPRAPLPNPPLHMQGRE